jgi:serine/threonine protein kinase
MEKMLEFDPRKRIDVHQALKHPWLAQLHDEAAEPSAPGGGPGGARCDAVAGRGPMHAMVGCCNLLMQDPDCWVWHPPLLVFSLYSSEPGRQCSTAKGSYAFA